MDDRRTDWFCTFTGAIVHVRDPKPESIRIVDIAHALSNLCRFGGHVREFYSVAQHSVLVSRIVPARFAFDALLHDAAEAYLGDLIRPLKREVASAYCPIELQWEIVIAIAFGLNPSPECERAVKQADRDALVTERRDLGRPEWVSKRWVEDEANAQPLALRIEHALPPAQAKEEFLDRYAELYALRCPPLEAST